jgi:hypothetical protein
MSVLRKSKTETRREEEANSMECCGSCRYWLRDNCKTLLAGGTCRELRPDHIVSTVYNSVCRMYERGVKRELE